MTDAMTYGIFKATRERLEAASKQASGQLRTTIAELAARFGLVLVTGAPTPDQIREQPEYRAAKAAYNAAHEALRKFNGQWADKFASETRADIAAKRAAKISENKT